MIWLRQLYIVGIHTDVGKTHFSAAFCKAFSYTYFKLLQAGSPTDEQRVKELSPHTQILPSALTLRTAASPHIGYKYENLTYNGLHLKIPQSDRLLIELAGGLFTPLDNTHTFFDYILANPRPIIVVGRYYLGCINHILLTLHALQNMPILALVMLKDSKDIYRDEIDEFVCSYTKIPLVHIESYTTQNLDSIANRLAHKLRPYIQELL
ncbi:dethiobiotin synthetase [Helicobacter cinaedi CCUG 18818 = ATCC BAA-847]|uniref:ATP-dependent dethiobiotin synthetase BioD n=1 Tax=Helicobacter cinaedi CCUG 18818 = ATCC BAA-847 TaxID=537971 RepID=A0AAI8QI68_9HELI|nr:MULTISPECIES: ATP-dependent dethiobiotin synthetase BioD [Helicobacter]BAM33509.1 dethiobiotin synthetase [Helicobacter cinaedi CCUG 18818 = ATCC BAA-847]